MRANRISPCRIINAAILTLAALAATAPFSILRAQSPALRGWRTLKPVEPPGWPSIRAKALSRHKTPMQCFSPLAVQRRWRTEALKLSR